MRPLLLLLTVCLAGCARRVPAAQAPSPATLQTRTSEASVGELALEEELCAGARCLEFLQVVQSVGDLWPAVRTDGLSVELIDERVHNMGWMAVAPGAKAAPGEFLAALDNQVGGPGWEVAVVRSTDGGRSWSLVHTVKKPDYLALASRIEARPGGGLCVTLVLAAEHRGEVPAGRYVACGNEDGSGWAAPRLSAPPPP